MSDLHKIFESRINEIVLDNGKIQKPTNRIWLTLKRQHEIVKSAGALYNDCWRWNNNRPKNVINDQGGSFDSELNSSLNELSLSDSEYDYNGQTLMHRTLHFL